MTDQITKDAIDQIARTANGQVLYHYLQKILSEICHDPDVGALRHHEGRRSLALDLMTLMGEGIDVGRGSTIIPGRRHNAGDNQPKRWRTNREYLASLPSWLDDPDGDAKSDAGTKPS